MGESERPPSLDDLEKRVHAAQEHRAARRRTKNRLGGTPAESSGIGLAFRIGVEMVSALVVGVAIGLLLDWWLGTQPLFLVVFFLLGAGASLLNAYRAAMGLGLAVGYRKPGGERKEEDEGDTSAGETAGADTADKDAGQRPEGKQS